MRKRFVFVLGIFLVLLFCNGVNAIVGVSPAIYRVDFEPNLEKSFKFDFLFDDEVKSEISVEGDLAEYVTLDRDSLTGTGRIIATLHLPSDIEVPGNHGIGITAKQIGESGLGMRVVGKVIGNIIVRVPYPGKYADVSLKIGNANAGDTVNFSVSISNLGKEDITTFTFLEIYDSQGTEKETIDLGSSFIETKKSKEIFGQLDTKNYGAGDYNAVAVVNYGEKTAKTERVFRLGELYVGVSNYTKEFERDKLNRFEIEVESFWNDPVDNVYANVTILVYNVSFLTPSAGIKPWAKQLLTGFFDASSIKDDRFQANITLHYEGESSSEIVDLKFREGVNYVLYGMIAGAILIMLILIIIIVILLKKVRKR